MQAPRTAARLSHFAVAIMAVAVLSRIWLSVFAPSGAYALEGATSDGVRGLRWATYAQVQSASLLMVSSGVLAMNLAHEARWLRVLRLAGVAGIVVTGFGHFIVADAAGRSGNVVLDVVVPLLTLMVWVVYGPRGHVSWWTVTYVIAWPVLVTLLLLILGLAAGGAYWDPLLSRSYRAPGPLLLTGMSLALGIAVLSGVLRAADRLVGHHASPSDTLA